MSRSPSSLASSLSVRVYSASHGSHSHDHFQVLVGLEGVLELEVQGRGQRIGVGAACVVPPGSSHDFSASAGSRCLVLDSSDTLWERHCAVAPSNPAHTLALARYLAHSLEQDQPLARLYGPLLLWESWMPASAPARRPRRRIDWPSLGAWAQARWHQPLTVADLAAAACLSPSQFAQRCMDENGLSAMAWLRALRLQQARLLRAQGLGVAETARRTGYRSPSALTVALRRQVQDR